MADNGYGPAVPGHLGRIPNYGKTQAHPMGAYEPPACIQNAMMTKDKKPFTYTPGGLDLSQIKCPSQARRFARQRSLEEHENAYGQQHNGGGYHSQGGPVPPPPPPPQVPAPPPPPPLVISVPHSKSPNPKPVPLGERPEIVIPENPIGMLRKTNSPYHWEAEKADAERLGPVPKFQDKASSPQNVHSMPPSNFSQQPPQSYYTPSNTQQPSSPYGSHTPSSPVHKPEPQYGNQRYATPVESSPPIRDALQRQDSQFNKSPQPFAGQSPVPNGSAMPANCWRQNDKNDSPVNDMRSSQPQQFNPNVKSSPQLPSQFNREVQSSPQSPPQYNRNIQNSPQAPTQLNRNIQNSPQSPPQYNRNFPNRAQSPPDFTRNTFSPNPQQHASNYQPSSPNIKNQSPVYHTLPRAGPKPQENYSNFAQSNGNVIQNNVARPQSPHVDASGAYAPWRNSQIPQSKAVPISSLYHNSQPTNAQPSYTPPWKRQQDINNAQQEQNSTSPWIQNQAQDVNNNSVQENNTPRWRQQVSDNRGPVSPPINQYQTQEPPRYQSSMTIPITPRKKHEEEPHKNAPQKEIVFVTQEPVYYCPDSPKAVPAWVKTQKEKTSTPPPEWCQKKLEGTKPLPRELTTPPRDNNTEPEWVKKSTEMQRGIRDVMSPPRYEPPQPTWSTIPSENRKSIPKDTEPHTQNGSRVIPVHIDSNTNGRQGQPQLRINVTLQQNESPQGAYTQPTQRIMRVLSPQLVRFDDGSTQSDLPSLSRNFTNQPPPPQQNQRDAPKTRIIPIQIEGGANDGSNKRVFYHRFTQEAPPRQSKAFRVLQVITGTEDVDHIRSMENQHGFTDL